MCDDLSYDYGKKRNEKKCVVKPGMCAERSKHNSVITRSHDGNFKALEDIVKCRDIESFESQKPAWKKHSGETTAAYNANLPLQQPRLESVSENNSHQNVIKHVKDTEKSDVFQSSGSFSFQAGCTNVASRHSETANAIDNTRYFAVHGRFKIQRVKERKSSLRNLAFLPPLAEEKCDRNSRKSPKPRRHTIGDCRERKDIEVPSIVLPEAEDDGLDAKPLKLPKIEVTNTKSRYPNQVPLSSQEPNRIAPPIYLEPCKAYRPPVLSGQSEDNNDSAVNAARLPQLRTRSSMTNRIEEIEKGVRRSYWF